MVMVMNPPHYTSKAFGSFISKWTVPGKLPGIFGTKTCLLIDYRKLKKSGEQYIAIEDLAYVSEIISGIVVATTLIILVF